MLLADVVHLNNFPLQLTEDAKTFLLLIATGSAAISAFLQLL